MHITGLRIAAGERVVGRAVSVNACQRVRDVRLDPAHGLLHDGLTVPIAQRQERGA